MNRVRSKNTSSNVCEIFSKSNSRVLSLHLYKSSHLKTMKKKTFRLQNIDISLIKTSFWVSTFLSGNDLAACHRAPNEPSGVSEGESSSSSSNISLAPSSFLFLHYVQRCKCHHQRGLTDYFSRPSTNARTRTTRQQQTHALLISLAFSHSVSSAPGLMSDYVGHSSRWTHVYPPHPAPRLTLDLPECCCGNLLCEDEEGGAGGDKEEEEEDVRCLVFQADFMAGSMNRKWSGHEHLRPPPPPSPSTFLAPFFFKPPVLLSFSLRCCQTDGSNKHLSEVQRVSLTTLINKQREAGDFGSKKCSLWALIRWHNDAAHNRF